MQNFHLLIATGPKISNTYVRMRDPSLQVHPMSPVCPGPGPGMRVSDKWIFYVSPSPAAAAGHWTDGRFKQRAV